MEKKDWEQRLEDFYFEREKILPDQSVGIDIDDWKEFISQELDKAERRGREKLVREIREAIREDVLIDDTEDKHISIDEDIVRIINDKEITEMYLDGEKELRYGGWGWYS